MEKSELIYSLSSTSSIEAYKNLKELQKSLKRGKFRRQFVEKDGINHLVSGLSFFNERHKQRQLDVTSRSSSEVNKSVDRSDVVRQILLCLKKLSIGNKNCISQFVKANGLTVLGELLQYCSNEVILKSICSLISTVAGVRSITLELVTVLVNILPQYQDTQLAVTILRTVWSICSSTDLACTAATAQGFPTVVKLLSSENENCARASIRVLHKLLKSSNNKQTVGLKVLESNGLQLLLALMHRDLSEDDYCLISDCLYHMIGIPQVRVSENCADFIHFCTTELTRDSSSRRFRNAFLSLCLCAMEAMNRIKIRCTGALEKFIDFLGQSQYSEYHFQIVSTFVCFLFDDPSLVVMLRAGLLPSLLNYLEGIMKLQSEDRLDEVSKTLLPNHSPFMSPDDALGPASADGSSPNILGARGPFHDTMLLLGKLSRTNAIRFMVSESCINPILKYLSTAEHFDSKAEKIVVRIAENPQFFERLLKLGIIQSIYFQLNTGYSIAHLEDVVAQVTSDQCREDNILRFGTDIISFREFPKACSCSSDKRKVDSRAENDELMNKEASNELKGNEDEPVPFRENNFKRTRCASSLISMLSHHAESPFGQGVLTHALVSDLNEIKEAFTIGYCFLCRSPQFQKHIFIDLKGLELIVSIILSSANDDKKLCHVFLALSGLAKSIGVSHKPRTKTSSFHWELNDDVKRVLDFDERTLAGTDSKRRKLSDSDQEGSKVDCCMFTNLFCKEKIYEYKRNVSSPLEMPKDGSDNVCFYLEDSVAIVTNRQAILSASPVFAAMLSSSFVDSSLPFVSLKDIHATSFILLLHHILGCTLDLESLSCAGGCKFSGTVEIRSRANVSDSCIRSRGHSIETERKFKKCKEEGYVEWEENRGEVNGRNIQRGPRKLETGDGYRPTESSCTTKLISEEQRLCLVTDIMRISDRFLLDMLRTECEEYLAKQLSDETVAVFYMEALSCQARLLSASCARYILADMEDPVAYLKTVVTLFNTVEKARFMTDLKSVLESQISNNQPYR